MSDISLKLIQQEIERLSKGVGDSGLSLEDVKKLEILVKTRQLLITNPVAQEPTEAAAELSDDDILKALKDAKAKKVKADGEED